MSDFIISQPPRQVIAESGADLLTVPPHDTEVIDQTNANNIIISYKKNGVIVATKTIATVGSVVTITVINP